MRFCSGFRLGALLVTAGLLPLAVSGTAVAASSPGQVFKVFKGEQSVLTAAQVRQLSADATKRSIIVFNNQLPNLPARGATAQARIKAANASQAGVRAELSQVHAKHVHGFHIVNAIAATISPAEASRLKADPAVRTVVPDTFRPFAPLGGGPGAASPAGRPVAGHSGSTATAATQQICPSDPAKPLIEPEARQVMNVDAAGQIVDGTGIKVGIIADGID